MRQFKILTLLLSLGLLILTPFDSHCEEEISLREAIMNPLQLIGKRIAWMGYHRKILTSGLPTQILISTNNYEWVASFYDANKFSDCLSVNSEIQINGMIIGTTPVYVEGTYRQIVNIMADGCKR